MSNVEPLLFERGIDVCHETVRFWWNRFGPLFVTDIYFFVRNIHKIDQATFGERKEPRFFALIGKAVLIGLGALICLGWLLAGLE